VRSDSPISGRTTHAAIWLIASRLGARFVDFALLLILARMLTPADFGIVAVAMTLIQITEAVFELPVGQVLVRTEHITRPMLDTAFTLGAIRGVGLAVLLAAASLPFASFYGDPRLAPLICFLSLAPALRGLLSPKMAFFAQAMDFRRDVAVEMGGKLSAILVAAVCAILTHSYWAIALGTVVTPAAMAILSYVLAPFAPRLSLSERQTFLGYLGWTTAAQAASALNWKMDGLVLARFVSHAQFGAFSLASDLSFLPEQAVIKPVVRPLLSAFSLIRNETDRLAQAYLKSANVILSIGLPVMVGLSLLAEPAVKLALGSKWLVAAPYLQLLALAVIPPLFTAPLGPLAMALGRPRTFLNQSLAELAVKLPATFVGVALFGVYGAIAARAVSTTAMCIVTAWMVRRLAGIPILRQLLSPWRSILGGMALAVTLLQLRTFLAPLQGLELAVGLAACAAAGLTVYGVVLFGLWVIAGRPAGIEATAISGAARLLPRRRG
jgi:O-antigen/teichoic acid export membrane protein